MADSERALGRLDRALDLATGPETRGLDRETQIELRIVESGIRRDQGFPEAAVVALQIPELTDGRRRPAAARLFYAYADALTDAGRADEARYWFARAASADDAGETDAADRADDLDVDVLDFDDLEAAELDKDDAPDTDDDEVDTDDAPGSDDDEVDTDDAPDTDDDEVDTGDDDAGDVETGAASRGLAGVRDDAR